MIRRLLPLGYAWMVLQGLLAIVLPRQTLKLNAKVLLRGYENPGDLEPKEWYVRSTRITGLGMLVTGLTGLLAGQVVDANAEADADGESDTADEETDGTDDPVELDI
jgi:hypothetical protein